MSFWSNLEGFFKSAESAYQTIAPEVAPAIALVKEGAGVVGALIPSTAPAIAVAEAAASSVAAIAPTAIQDAATLIADGRAAVANLGDPLTALWKSLDGLFEATPAPGGTIILTPKTAAATAPGAALSAAPAA